MSKKLPKGITLRKDGRYMWRFRYLGISYCGYCWHWKEAEIAMYRKKYEVYNHIPEPLETPQLNKWFPEWLFTYKRNCKPLTLYTYQHVYKNYIQPSLGEYPLAMIQTEDLQKVVNDLSEHYSRTIVNTTRVLLFDMLEQARKLGLLSDNAMRNICVPRSEEKKPRTVLTAEEERVFLEEARSSYYYPLYKLATLTGMRLGEITALRWEDVDIEKRVLHIRHTLDYTKEKGLFLETPKTKSSLRDIPMVDAAAELLLEHRRRIENGGAANLSSPTSPFDLSGSSEKALSSSAQLKSFIPGLVFTNCKGKPLYQACIHQDLSRIIRRMMDQHLINRRFSFHTLRHCFATRCVEQGMSYKTLQSILGHRSLSTTMDIYAHSLEETRRDEMKRIASHLDL